LFVRQFLPDRLVTHYNFSQVVKGRLSC
jgi:hypothetical protein